MPTRHVAKKDLLLLKQHLVDKAHTCLHRSSGLLKNRFVIPTYDANAGSDDNAAVADRSTSGAYLQMYDWDACLFAQLAYKAGIDGLPQAIVSNFLSMQEPTGFVPRTVSPGRIWDSGDLCKPFLCQTLLHDLHNKPRKAAQQIEPLLPGLKRFLDYYRNNHRHPSGLYSWRNVLASGIDNNYALLAPREASKDEERECVLYPDGQLLAVDLSTYLVGELRAYASLAQRCGRREEVLKVKQEASQLASTIGRTLFDPQLNMYVNLHPEGNRPVRIRSWTGLMPVLFGIASKSRTLRVLEHNVLNEQHFLRPYGIASMAASEPLSNQAPRGLYGRAIVCNWNGPVWILPNALTVRTLLAHDLVEQAKEVSRRVLSAMINGLKQRGALFENYNADTGAPLWAPRFMSWNLMALEMIELLEGKVPLAPR
jgi:hypothetical protein